jgi:hypothetical protein
VNERGGLQGVTRCFIHHPDSGKFAQFLVNERQQLVGGCGVAILGRFQNTRDIAHTL